VNTRIAFARLPLRPLAAAGLLLIAGCGREPPAAPAPALVIAMPVHARGAMAQAARLPVDVQARYVNTLSFRIAGKLIGRTVRLGDTVHAGQVVAKLDDQDARSQTDAAQAALRAAEHRLTYARAQAERDRAQAAQNLIATNQLEQTEDALASAAAGRDQAAAQLQLTQDALRYTRLEADHDGVISSENADTGTVVTAGQPVFGLAWNGDVDLVLDASASTVASIHPGTQAIVSFPAVPGRTFAASVREIAPAADPQSRTWRVKLTLLQSPPQVHLGMTGSAALVPDQGTAAAGPAVFEVPATALFHKGQEPAVWVVRSDSTLELRTIQTDRYDERTAAITSGLREGEQVIQAGVHTVFAGEHVRVTAPLYQDTGSDDAASGTPQ
jgi:membrane fusion protein, multidrug efflux system